MRLSGNSLGSYIMFFDLKNRFQNLKTIEKSRTGTKPEPLMNSLKESAKPEPEPLY